MSKSWAVSPPKPDWEWDDELSRNEQYFNKETKREASVVDSHVPGTCKRIINENKDRGLVNYLSAGAGIERTVPFRYSVTSDSVDDNLHQGLDQNLRRGSAFGPLEPEWDFESAFKGSIFEFNSTDSLHTKSSSNMSIVRKSEFADRPESESSIMKECQRPLTPEPPCIENENQQKKKKKKTHKALPTSVRVFKTNVDRDPRKVNDDLKVHFGEIITEPAGFYSPKFTWNLSHEMYNFGKGCCYSLIALIFGIPFAFIWGIVFAIVACLNVWILTPIRKGHNINMLCISGFWDIFVSSCCDPLYRSIGNIFSRIRVSTDSIDV